MPSLRAFKNIDPAIVKSLAEKLPSGPSGILMTRDVCKFKWEYAVVIIDVIEDLKWNTMENSLCVLRTIVWNRLERYWHVLQLSNMFQNFMPLLLRLQNQTLEINAEYLDDMLVALAQDMALFGDHVPAALFLNFDEWKLHDAMDMLEEMKLPKGDFHSHVKGIYSRYQDVMRSTGGNHEAAMNAFPVNMSPLGYTMMVNATLTNRIQALEMRLARLEETE